MTGNQPPRIRQGRESQTASARRERATAQLASTRGRGRGRRVRVPQDLVESSSPSGYRSRLARVSSSRQREKEDDDEEEEEEVIPDVDPPVGEEEEQEVDSYPGGPFETSLLIHYQDHVARRIWEGEVFFLT